MKNVLPITVNFVLVRLVLANLKSTLHLYTPSSLICKSSIAKIGGLLVGENNTRVPKTLLSDQCFPSSEPSGFRLSYLSKEAEKLWLLLVNQSSIHHTNTNYTELYP